MLAKMIIVLAPCALAGGLGGGLGGMDNCPGCAQEDTCADDQERIEQLKNQLNVHLAEKDAKTAEVEPFEKCEEQLVFGTNLFLSFKMTDNSYTHVRFYKAFFS